MLRAELAKHLGDMADRLRVRKEEFKKQSLEEEIEKLKADIAELEEQSMQYAATQIRKTNSKELSTTTGILTSITVQLQLTRVGVPYYSGKMQDRAIPGREGEGASPIHA